jgi:hypothetical protein
MAVGAQRPGVPTVVILADNVQQAFKICIDNAAGNTVTVKGTGQARYSRRRFRGFGHRRMN